MLTEKPPALHGDELRQLIAARGDRVGACCSSRHRFLPSAQEATRIIASGELGPLRVLRARGVTSAGPLPKNPPPAWRVSHKLNGGGITVNWGVYDLDYLLGLVGWSVTPRLALAQAFPVAAHLAGRVADGSDAETHLVGLVTTEEGCAISFERAEFAATQPDHAWEIIGERGSLVLRLLPGAGNELIQITTTAEGGVHREVVWQGDETFDMAHAGPVEDFAHAILDGTEPLTSLERALVVQATIDAMYASAASGDAQPVRI